VLITLAVHVEWILEVFGFDQWLEAVPLVRIMAVIGLLRCVTPLLPQLLNAAGLSRLNFFYSLVCAIVLPVAFVVGARWGLEGVAWSWVVGYPLVVLVLVVFSARVLELRLGETLRLLWGELWLLAGPLAVSLGLLLALGRLFPDPNPVTLVLSMGATLALGLWLVYHRHRETLLTVARRGRSRA
jgi:O-antigen/teichoic acid export membrane protein